MLKHKKQLTHDMWKIVLFILVWITLAALLLTACTPAARADPLRQTEPTAVSHGNEIGGYVEVVDALRAQNAAVESAGTISQPFFEVQGQVIKISGAEVQVFEFADEVTREAAASLISPDGSYIGTSMVTWIDQPNLWAAGRVIVLYVGSDATTIELLTSVLGEPIAQGQKPAGYSILVGTQWVLFSFGWPGAETQVEPTDVSKAHRSHWSSMLASWRAAQVAAIPTLLSIQGRETACPSARSSAL